MSDCYCYELPDDAVCSVCTDQNIIEKLEANVKRLDKENDKLIGLSIKYRDQVIDTCKRAEKAETEVERLKAELIMTQIERDATLDDRTRLLADNEVLRSVYEAAKAWDNACCQPVNVEDLSGAIAGLHKAVAAAKQPEDL